MLILIFIKNASEKRKALTTAKSTSQTNVRAVTVVALKLSANGSSKTFRLLNNENSEFSESFENDVQNAAFKNECFFYALLRKAT